MLCTGSAAIATPEVEVEENIDNAAGVCGLVIVTPRAAGEFEVLEDWISELNASCKPAWMDFRNPRSVQGGKKHVSRSRRADVG